MVAHLGDAHLGDAHRRLVIPAVIPTAGRSGDMTIAVPQEIDRAVIDLMGIDHPAIVHQAVAHRQSAMRMIVLRAIAAPLNGPSAIVQKATATP